MAEQKKPLNPRGNPFEKYAKPLPDFPVPDHVDEEMTADVVIIGGGHGGTQCALAAAEGGASVIVIERKPEDRFTYVGEQVGVFNSIRLEYNLLLPVYYHCSRYYFKFTGCKFEMLSVTGSAVFRLQALLKMN